MKKLLTIVMTAALALPMFAQQTEKAVAANDASDTVERRGFSSQWPAFFAVADYPASPELVGMRITIPYSTKQDSVTGFDLGFWGRSTYFEGFQLNIFRSDVKDYGAGVQVGCYNSIGRGDMLGVQVGLLNESESIRGLQAGLVNMTGEACGFQIGLINRCEEMYGFQIGLVNIIRDAEIAFFPVLNIGF